MYCSQCGTLSVDNAKFCHVCGTQLEEKAQEINQTASTPPQNLGEQFQREEYQRVQHLIGEGQAISAEENELEAQYLIDDGRAVSVEKEGLQAIPAVVCAMTWIQLMSLIIGVLTLPAAFILYKHELACRQQEEEEAFGNCFFISQTQRIYFAIVLASGSLIIGTLISIYETTSKIVGDYHTVLQLSYYALAGTKIASYAVDYDEWDLLEFMGAIDEYFVDVVLLILIAVLVRMTWAKTSAGRHAISRQLLNFRTSTQYCIVLFYLVMCLMRVVAVPYYVHGSNESKVFCDLLDDSGIQDPELRAICTALIKIREIMIASAVLSAFGVLASIMALSQRQNICHQVFLFVIILGYAAIEIAKSITARDLLQSFFSSPKYMFASFADNNSFCFYLIPVGVFGRIIFENIKAKYPEKRKQEPLIDVHVVDNNS